MRQPRRSTLRRFEKYLKSGSGRAFTKRHFAEVETPITETVEGKFPPSA
jgi:hypothetical protein